MYMFNFVGPMFSHVQPVGPIFATCWPPMFPSPTFLKSKLCKQNCQPKMLTRLSSQSKLDNATILWAKGNAKVCKQNNSLCKLGSYMFDLKTLQRMGAGNICFPKKCNRLFVHTHQFEKINNTGTNKIVFSGDGQREVSSWGLRSGETL